MTSTPEAAPDWKREFITPPGGDGKPGVAGVAGVPRAKPLDGRKYPAPITPSEVIQRWRRDGPLVRVPTGIKPLDDASRGGLPIPWRMIIIGAPSAGKTFVEVSIADTLARTLDAAGVVVGVLAVDEEPEDLTVRLAQIAGFTVAQAELRDPETLDQMEVQLAPLRIRLYDANYTIDAAAADLAAWAKAQGRRAALFIDSIQAARSVAALGAESPREQVEANIAAMRAASTGHRMLVIATAEANRGAYRNDAATEQGNDMAAGAESRAIEFGAQTLLMLRTPKDHPDTIHVRIVKNRRSMRGIDFWLRLDRDRHKLTECPEPTADPSARAAEQTRAREGIKAALARDADDLLRVLRMHPTGISEKALRAALPGAGLKWGVERMEAAKVALAGGHRGVRLVDRGAGGKGAARAWCLGPIDDSSGPYETSATDDTADVACDVAETAGTGGASGVPACEDALGERTKTDAVAPAQPAGPPRASPSTSAKLTGTSTTPAHSTNTLSTDATGPPSATNPAPSTVGPPPSQAPHATSARTSAAGNVLQDRRARAIVDAVRAKSLTTASAIWAEIGGKRGAVLALVKAMLSDGRLCFESGRFRVGQHVVR